MKKNWILVVFLAACLLVVVAYQAGKVAGENAGKNSAELAFQKEKEATRKAEFVKLQRIHEEEKRAEEKRRREEKLEEREKEAVRMLMELKNRQEDRQTALYRMLLEGLTKTTEYQPTIPNYRINDYPAVTSTKDSPVSSSATKLPQKGFVSAIVVSEDNPSAVINDTVVHEGDTIDGVTVVKIHKDRVAFEMKGTNAIIRWTQKIGEAPIEYWE